MNFVTTFLFTFEQVKRSSHLLFYLLFTLFSRYESFNSRDIWNDGKISRQVTCPSWFQWMAQLGAATHVARRFCWKLTVADRVEDVLNGKTRKVRWSAVKFDSDSALNQTHGNALDLFCKQSQNIWKPLWKHRKTRTPIELWIRVVYFSYFFHCIVETCWKSQRSCGDSELVGTMAWYFLCSMAKSLTLSSSSSCFLTSFSRIVRQLCSHPETWPLQHVRPANCVKGATHKKPARPVRKFISSCKKNNLKGEAPLPWNNIVQVS